MSITCLNCGHELDESTISGSYRDGFDEHRAIWILDQVIRCTNCDLVMGRSLSNDQSASEPWDFYRATELKIIANLNEQDVEGVRARLKRYPLMLKDLDTLLDRRRPGDRTVRYNAGQTTGIAVIRHDGVLGVFVTLLSL